MDESAGVVIGRLAGWAVSLTISAIMWWAIIAALRWAV